MEVKKVGIIGAGVMGMGIAQKMICYDKEVILVDNDASVVNSVKNRIQRNMMIARITNKDNTDIAHALSLLSVTDDYSALSGCDHIIENIPENEDMKYEVYRKLSDIVSENCICMANTSCISITKIAKWLGNSQNVIGVHFMNPVPLQKFAEVIKGNFTSDDTIEKVKSFLKEMDDEIKNSMTAVFEQVAVKNDEDKKAVFEALDNLWQKGSIYIELAEVAKSTGITLATLRSLDNETQQTIVYEFMMDSSQTARFYDLVNKALAVADLDKVAKLIGTPVRELRTLPRRIQENICGAYTMEFDKDSTNAELIDNIREMIAP